MANYDRKDRLYRQAKSDGYRSRAAYKLQELDAKVKLLKPGMTVLDLGCFPGGWLQVALEKVGRGGAVVGVDLQPVEPVTVGGRSAVILLGDLYEPTVQESVLEQAGGRVDVVLSDMSPKLTGVRFQDAARSAALVELALFFSSTVLKEGGSVVAKVFPGNECEEAAKVYRRAFEKFTRHVLDSSRKTSKELYFVGRGFRGLPEELQAQVSS
ncbi:MAG: RlmE family RNA methyltransferase [Bdellovibrionales bacterium]|nr:RlmE family RNA methyltransferase [Bdellovibrionales bacterium]